MARYENMDSTGQRNMEARAAIFVHSKRKKKPHPLMKLKILQLRLKF